MKRHVKGKKLLAWALMLMLMVTAAPVYAGGSSDFSNYDYEKDVVWLHVINGNFKAKEDLGDGYEGKDISKMASVPVKLGADRTLPAVVDKIDVTRTNGEFDGWYTKAPTEELQTKGEEGSQYSVWHTVKTNGQKIQQGGQVPEDINTLYAAFTDKAADADQDKLVTFYMDWNGIKGLFGHCLTCTRSYKNGAAVLTADDAAIYNLNFDSEDKKMFDKASDAEKWAVLKKIWNDSDKTYDGYTFKGWSTDIKGTQIVWADTPITNGMSFYAQWEKGDSSSQTFERTDPAAGPLENIRIQGDGLSSSMSASKHAQPGASFILSVFRTPVRAEAKDVTWELSVSEKDQDNPYKTNTTTFKVTAGKENPQSGCDGIEVKAEGCALTITTRDDTPRSIEAGVTALSKDGQLISSPVKATVSFVHTWDQGQKDKEPSCTEGATVTYNCTTDGCQATKVEKVSALGHVYDKRVDDGKYNVLQEPTCTTDGEKQFICIRCGDENGQKAAIPALGHDWKETASVPYTCNQNQVTRVCQREDCGKTETFLAPVDNPDIDSDLHVWKETDRWHLSCQKDRVFERCDVCGQTRKYEEAANNPDYHAWAFKSRMSVDCQTVEYTYECAHGCGSQQVQLKKEENHIWGDWKTEKAPTTKATGLLVRKCSRCHEEETKIIPRIAVSSSIKDRQDSTQNSAQNNVQSSQTLQTSTALGSVKYVLNGGKNNSQNPTRISSNVTLKSPTKKGYAFKGWYQDSKFKQKISTVTSGEKQVTAYAKWQKVSVGKAALSSVKKSGSKKVKVKIRKVSGAKGYEVVYSTNKKLKSSKKVTVKSASATLKNLKKNKKYYVKVRAYKTDSAGKKVYGKYSGVKSVKTK